MKDKKKVIIIVSINYIYFLLILICSNYDFGIFRSLSSMIVLLVIGVLLSLFSSIFIKKIRKPFNWIFFIINMLIILIYLYEIYFYRAIDNSWINFTIINQINHCKKTVVYSLKIHLLYPRKIMGCLLCKSNNELVLDRENYYQLGVWRL